MAFHDTRFPTDVAYGFRALAQWRTQIVTLGNGEEERNQQWSRARRRYAVGFNIRAVSVAHALLAFYQDRRGAFHSFRFKDWFDFKSVAPDAAVSATDQALGTGDGVVTAFQLAKTYGAVDPYRRTITKPVSGTVVVALDGVAQGSGWSVDLATGVITFLSAPGVGVAVTAGFEFDVECRFETDDLEATILANELGEFAGITVVEVI